MKDAENRERWLADLQEFADGDPDKLAYLIGALDGLYWMIANQYEHVHLTDHAMRGEKAPVVEVAAMLMAIFGSHDDVADYIRTSKARRSKAVRPECSLRHRVSPLN